MFISKAHACLVVILVLALHLRVCASVVLIPCSSLVLGSDDINVSDVNGTLAIHIASCKDPVVISVVAPAAASLQDLSISVFNCSNIANFTLSAPLRIQNTSVRILESNFSGGLQISARETNMLSLVFESVRWVTANVSCVGFSFNSTHTDLMVTASNVSAVFSGFYATWLRFDNITSQRMQIAVMDSSFSGASSSQTSPWNYAFVLRFGAGRHSGLSVALQQLTVNLTVVNAYYIIKEVVSAGVVAFDHSLFENSQLAATVLKDASVWLNRIRSFIGGLSTVVVGIRMAPKYPTQVYNVSVLMTDVSNVAFAQKRGMMFAASRADDSPNGTAIGNPDDQSLELRLEGCRFSSSSPRLGAVTSDLTAFLDFSFHSCIFNATADVKEASMLNVVSMYDVKLPRLVISIYNTTFFTMAGGIMLSVGQNPKGEASTSFQLMQVSVRLSESTVFFGAGGQLIFIGLITISSWYLEVVDSIVAAEYQFMSILFAGASVGAFSAASVRSRYSAENCAGFVLAENTALMPLMPSLFPLTMGTLSLVFVDSSFSSRYVSSRVPPFNPADLVNSTKTQDVQFVAGILTYFLSRLFSIVPIQCLDLSIDLSGTTVDAFSGAAAVAFATGSVLRSVTLRIVDSLLLLRGQADEMLYCSQATLVSLMVKSSTLSVSVTVLRTTLLLSGKFVVGVVGLGHVAVFSRMSISILDSAVTLESNGVCYLPPPLAPLPARPSMFFVAAVSPTVVTLTDCVISGFNITITFNVSRGARTALVSDLVGIPNTMKNCTFSFVGMKLRQIRGGVPLSLMLLEASGTTFEGCSVYISDCELTAVRRFFVVTNGGKILRSVLTVSNALLLPFSASSPGPDAGPAVALVSIMTAAAASDSLFSILNISRAPPELQQSALWYSPLLSASSSTLANTTFSFSMCELVSSSDAPLPPPSDAPLMVDVSQCSSSRGSIVRVNRVEVSTVGLAVRLNDIASPSPPSSVNTDGISVDVSDSAIYVWVDSSSTAALVVLTDSAAPSAPNTTSLSGLRRVSLRSVNVTLPVIQQVTPTQIVIFALQQTTIPTVLVAEDLHVAPGSVLLALDAGKRDAALVLVSAPWGDGESSHVRLGCNWWGHRPAYFLRRSAPSIASVGRTSIGCLAEPTRTLSCRSLAIVDVFPARISIYDMLRYGANVSLLMSDTIADITVDLRNANISWGFVEGAYLSQRASDRRSILTFYLRAAKRVVLSDSYNMTISVGASGPSLCSDSTAEFSVELSSIFMPTPLPARRAAAAVSLAVTFATVVSFPSISSQLARQSAMLSLSVCSFSSTEPLSFAESPLGLAVGSEEGGYIRGAVIGNSLLMVAASLGGGIIALGKAYLDRDSKRYAFSGKRVFFQRALADIGLPGNTFVAFSALMAPAMSCAVTLLSTPSTSYDSFLGFGVLAACAAYGVWTGYLSTVGLKSRPVPVAPVDAGASSNNIVSAVLGFWDGSTEWVDIYPVTYTSSRRCSSSSSSAVVSFTEAFGPLFDGYRTHAWFFVVEVVSMAALSVLAGVRPLTPAGCSTVNWLVETVNVVMLISALTLKPYKTLVDSHFFTYSCASAGLCGALILIGSEGALMASDIFTMMQIYAATVLAAVNVVMTLAGIVGASGLFSDWRSKRSRRNRERRARRAHRMAQRKLVCPPDAMEEGWTQLTEGLVQNLRDGQGMTLKEREQNLNLLVRAACQLAQNSTQD
jgi:hypothetical protein